MCILHLCFVHDFVRASPLINPTAGGELFALAMSPRACAGTAAHRQAGMGQGSGARVVSRASLEQLKTKGEGGGSNPPPPLHSNGAEGVMGFVSVPAMRQPSGRGALARGHGVGLAREVPPTPLQSAQPMPSYCLPDGKCQAQSHL